MSVCGSFWLLRELLYALYCAMRCAWSIMAVLRAVRYDIGGHTGNPSTCLCLGKMIDECDAPSGDRLACGPVGPVKNILHPHHFPSTTTSNNS